jgi:hypothetical protein
MEIFLLLFILGLWIYLSSPKKEPPRKDPWEELGKAIGSAVKSINATADDKKGGSGNKDSFPWFIPLAIVAGLAVYLFR